MNAPEVELTVESCPSTYGEMRDFHAARVLRSPSEIVALVCSLAGGVASIATILAALAVGDAEAALFILVPACFMLAWPIRETFFLSPNQLREIDRRAGARSFDVTPLGIETRTERYTEFRKWSAYLGYVVRDETVVLVTYRGRIAKMSLGGVGSDRRAALMRRLEANLQPLTRL